MVSAVDVQDIRLIDTTNNANQDGAIVPEVSDNQYMRGMIIPMNSKCK